MRFVKYGRTYQLDIRSAEDLQQVLQLDESLWMATAAPVSQYRLDSGFLAAVDADGNGRISSNELKQAIRWLLERLADSSAVAAGHDALSFAAINQAIPAGEALVESARYVLERVAAAESETITLKQVRDFLASVQARPLNGDGIIVPESSDDPQVRGFIQQVIRCTGGQPDSSGRTGVSTAQVDAFLKAIPPYLQWLARGRLADGEVCSEVLPFGADTEAMFTTFRLNADKIDLFFRLCDLLQFEPRAALGAPGAEASGELVPVATSEGVSTLLGGLPLAAPNSPGQLPLDERRINPLYRAWISTLKRRVVEPILGEVPESLDAVSWGRIRGAFAPYAAYLGDRPGSMLQGVSAELLETYLDPTYALTVRALIEADHRVADVVSRVRDLERLLLHHAYLLRLANNFVSFPELYDLNQRALFELGSLVMDGRWFNLAVRADDVAAHSAVAKQGNLFVMYLEVNAGGGRSFHLAVPVTSGARGNLAVGKRGVFFAADGQEFDARVTQVIENPVSVREALAVPFVRLWRIAEDKIEAWSGSAEKQLQSEFDKTLTATTGAAPPPPAAAPPPPVAGNAVLMGRGGMLMGLGVATAALGSSFAFITKTFSGMHPLHVTYGFIGAALAVVLPISLIAYLKLRRQDLSSLLEGAGWAVNARMRLSRAQRRHFTRQAPFPPGALGTPRRRWLRNVLLLVLAVLVAVILARQCPGRRATDGAPSSGDPGPVPAAAAGS